MTQTGGLSCYLIGSNSLLVKCGEILLDRGHRVLGVISDAPRLSAWATERGLASYAISGGYLQALVAEPFDYLFSITHLAVIPDDVLALPRRGTINFHDGPLPGYAGLHAPAWGLMRGVRDWAVTFHVVSSQLDRGDILAQTPVTIAPDETSFTLNAKCFEAGIATFARLIDELASGAARPRTQDVTAFEYFGRHRRPDAGCVLDWSRPASELEALVRALDFGHYPNPLGSPKIFRDGQALVVTQAQAWGDAAGEPGEIRSIDDRAIRVATGSGELTISGLADMNGRVVPIRDMVRSWVLAPGVRLTRLDPARAQRLSDMSKSLSQAEQFWTRRLGNVVGPELPGLSTDIAGGPAAPRGRLQIALPAALVKCYGLRLDAALIAAVGIYLARIGSADSFDIAYRDDGVRRCTAGLESFLAPYLPLRLAPDQAGTFDQFVDSVEGEIKWIRNRGPYLRDLIARSPELHAGASAMESALARIVVEAGSDSNQTVSDSFLRFVIAWSAPLVDADRARMTDIPYGDQDLLFRIEYSQRHFAGDVLARMLGHLQTLLEGIATHPQARLSDLPLLTEAERRQLLVDLNRTTRDYPRKALMQELFEAQAARAPGRTALRCGSTVLSYAELDTRASRIAQALRSRGVGRGQRVGLCVERGADMLAAVLGILKAGAAYVPLDPSFPQERLRFMAEDAQLALLVSTSALAGTFGLPRERQLLLDADAKSIDAALDTRLPVDAHSAQPEDPAYVIYTSGSTGKPKGVVVPHRAVVNFLTSMAREPGLAADDVLVAVTTLSFDIAVLELQLPLTLGATVVIASREEAIDGHALGALLEQTRATVMQATPVTWRLLLEAGWKGGKDFKALIGGEGLPQDLADQLIASGVELWNMYGPTETTVWSTCARITDTSNGITIGKPIANTTVYILDAQKNLCPIGVPGELCVGGDGVTLGYWNRPELSADRFIPDPFSTVHGARLYRTGDRARWRNDGTLEHLGRLDFQVKIRGYRIELGEIEAVLAEHPEVHQAAVHLWRAKADDVRIVACCVPAKAGVLAPISLRKHMRARLPEYMVPQHFLAIDEIPLTPNGKVDRRRLPTPVVAESRVAQHEAPADPVEATIAEVWTNLICPSRPIGRSDKFFEMGGHSLLGLKALLQIETKLGVRLDFRVLLQESLADIAARCRPQSGAKAARPSL